MTRRLDDSLMIDKMNSVYSLTPVPLMHNKIFLLDKSILSDQPSLTFVNLIVNDHPISIAL